MKKQIYYTITAIIIVIILLIILPLNKSPKTQNNTLEEVKKDIEKNWRNIEIEDVITNEKITINGINKPIIFESFAVWCPTCKKQQDEIKKLHEEIGDSAISISLDTDPNEDKEQVINHLTKYEYDWIFAISPTELTKSLIDEFGTNVVNAPQAPVIIICKNKETKFLERGVKSAEKLKEEINC